MWSDNFIAKNVFLVPSNLKIKSNTKSVRYRSYGEPVCQTTEKLWLASGRKKREKPEIDEDKANIIIGFSRLTTPAKYEKAWEDTMTGFSKLDMRR